MSQEKFWVLLSKKLSREASEEELTELEALIVEHPEWQYAIQNLGDLWNHESAKDTGQEEDAYLLHLHRMKELDIPFDELPAAPPVRGFANRTRKWYWMAATLLIIVAVAGFMLLGKGSNEQKNTITENEISTRRGSRTRVQLPDGSVVMLNAGSKLTYNKDFGKVQREVTLTGEGFFDVQKMKGKPFIIHTARLDIKVLGTLFNVKAYPEDSQTETSLVHGRVEVTMPDRPNNKIILSDNEKLLVYNNKNGVARVNQPDRGSDKHLPLVAVSKLTYQQDDTVAVETSWAFNKLSFKDELFSDVARKMERWYDVTFDFDNIEKQNLVVYGSFTTETLQEALEALVFSFGFRYKIEGKKVTIY